MVTAKKTQARKKIGNLVAKAHAVRGEFYSVIANPIVGEGGGGVMHERAAYQVDGIDE